ncbi:MAG: hypothetical protein KF729_08420 [Sandaracinaceae bacterium]|nr:hypothetical protein [Sandaracinaceae bacterium]
MSFSPTHLRLVIALLAGAGVASPSVAGAQDAASPYCRRVRAEAESRAFLLLSPRMMVQALHVPLVGGDTTGMGVVQGQPWQARAALSFSPMDMARGALVLDQATADCERHVAREELGRTLASDGSYGRLTALRAQLAYLASQQPVIDQLVLDAQTARDDQLITMQQLNDVRLRANAIARHVQSLEAEAERLREDEAERHASGRPIRAQLEDYEGRAIAFARAASELRRLSPWQINVSAGVVPLATVDWFGAIELSYNLGGIAQAFAEDAAVRAYEEELRESDQEARRAVERFERRMRTSARDLRDELALLDAQARLMDEQRALLVRTGEETAEATQSLRMVEMNRIELEGERVYSRALLAEREAVGGERLGTNDER